MNPDSSSSRAFVWLRNVAVLGVLSAAISPLATMWFDAPVADLGKIAAPACDDVKAVAAAFDAEFARSWTSQQLTPAPQADDLTLVRRLSLALTGSIPSLQEVREIERLPEGERSQRWLSLLLEDRRTSDYLAERLARVYVGIETGPFLIYRRRRLVEWLSDSLLKNQPYDQIVRSLITAHGVWTTSPAVNFISVTNVQRKGPDEKKLAAKVSRAFLGVRIDCVECHDGKLDSPWKQSDFHQLAAYFGQTKFELNGLVEKPKQQYKTRYLGEVEEVAIPAKVPWKPELQPESGAPRERLAAWVTSKENKAFARSMVNRMWALLFNRPLISPVDDIPLEGPFPAGMEVLAADFIAHDYDIQRLIRVIVASRPFQVASQGGSEHAVTATAEKYWAAFPVTRLRAEQMAGSVIQAASIGTLDSDAHVLFRIKRFFDVTNFVQRYGDTGEDNFEDEGGTIPQRLLLMNGNMVADNIKTNPLVNAGTRISMLAPDSRAAVESAYLAIFTRQPTAPEADHFEVMLADARSQKARNNAMADIYWTLMNATEFSWNH